MEHPFPPERLDWQFWICPGMYALAALAVLIRAFRSKSEARDVILVLLAAATVSFLLWYAAMLPRLEGAREAAPRTQCRNNLHALGEAIQKWHDEHGRLPDPVFHEGDASDVTWRVRLAPYLGDDTLVSDYDATAAWDDAANLPVARRDPLPYRCPTSRDPMDARQRYFTAYALITGDDTAFPDTGPLSFNQISDGLGQTLLVGEACGARIVWTEPRDVIVSEKEPVGVNLPGPAEKTSDGPLSSYHEGGAFGVFADGRVSFLNDGINSDVLRALMTADRGDVADPDEF